MKTSTTIGLLFGAAIIGGGVWLATRDDGEATPGGCVELSHGVYRSQQYVIQSCPGASGEAPAIVGVLLIPMAEPVRSPELTTAEEAEAWVRGEVDRLAGPVTGTGTGWTFNRVSL